METSVTHGIEVFVQESDKIKTTKNNLTIALQDSKNKVKASGLLH